ncbi:MAG: hypothetical protein WCW01_03450 [Gammaproteobacteria bacterium]
MSTNFPTSVPTQQTTTAPPNNGCGCSYAHIRDALFAPDPDGDINLQLYLSITQGSVNYIEKRIPTILALAIEINNLRNALIVINHFSLSIARNTKIISLPNIQYINHLTGLNFPAIPDQPPQTYLERIQLIIKHIENNITTAFLNDWAKKYSEFHSKQSNNFPPISGIENIRRAINAELTEGVLQKLEQRFPDQRKLFQQHRNLFYERELLYYKKIIVSIQGSETDETIRYYLNTVYTNILTRLGKPELEIKSVEQVISNLHSMEEALEYRFRAQEQTASHTTQSTTTGVSPTTLPQNPSLSATPAASTSTTNMDGLSLVSAPLPSSSSSTANVAPSLSASGSSSSTPTLVGITTATSSSTTATAPFTQPPSSSSIRPIIDFFEQKSQRATTAPAASTSTAHRNYPSSLFNVPSSGSSSSTTSATTPPPAPAK